MKIVFKFFLWGCILLSPRLSFAQFTKGLNYRAEAGISLSGGEHTPFWLAANKQGLSSLEKNNGYLRAGIFRPFEADKRFSYSLGVDLAVAYHFTSTFIVQQLYADLKYRCLGVSIGSKERYSEFNNPLLSSGGLIFSGNARPIPQIRIGIPEYTTIPGTKSWVAFKGHIAYGMFTDDGWQKDFVAAGGKRTEQVLYHSKDLYVKIGNREKLPFIFEGSLEMTAQFGGNAYIGDKKIDMPNRIKDFFRVFIPSAGGDNTPLGEQLNVYGNHLGSWNFSLTWYAGKDWTIRPYYEHMFEDHSQMFGEYGWKDCLAGIEITFPKNRIISSFVYEYMLTKDQSGPVYWDHTPEIPEQVSGTDSYYNHGIYTGWQHGGMGIGNPLIASPLYNADGEISFKSNRLQGHHFGLMGNPIDELQYRILLSVIRHWGTYSRPFYEIKRNANALAEVKYMPRQLKGWDFTASLGIDGGSLLDESAGGMITIRKTGWIR